MAAVSISFAHTARRPWDKRQAVVGTLAPDTDQAIEIRISDTITGAAGFKPEEVYAAVAHLVERLRELRQPPN